eukprot:SAG11_NODE_146_length_14788_cov_5.672884_9_plen_181_part_00
MCAGSKPPGRLRVGREGQNTSGACRRWLCWSVICGGAVRHTAPTPSRASAGLNCVPLTLRPVALHVGCRVVQQRSFAEDDRPRSDRLRARHFPRWEPRKHAPHSLYLTPILRVHAWAQKPYGCSRGEANWARGDKELDQQQAKGQMHLHRLYHHIFALIQISFHRFTCSPGRSTCAISCD